MASFSFADNAEALSTVDSEFLLSHTLLGARSCSQRIEDLTEPSPLSNSTYLSSVLCVRIAYPQDN